ncbi:MAG: tryptophan synthase subunit alpha [Thermodesulfobacteriota bacterium]
MALEERIRALRSKKDILLMTHIVLGYPSLAVNRRVIKAMVDAGVDLIELQIPFSEPMADGPVILKANQVAIESGIRVAACLDFAREMVQAHPIPFLFMTYCNIVFRHGEEAFLDRAVAAGIKGVILPDLPPEEGADFLALARAKGVAPILIYAPTSTGARMRELAGHAAGFIYCVARKGVTGKATRFDADLAVYLGRCRAATSLPLAVGFGLRSREDVQFLTGKADIAVVGSETIRVVDRDGPDAVGPFLAGLLGR